MGCSWVKNSVFAFLLVILPAFTWAGEPTGGTFGPAGRDDFAQKKLSYIVGLAKADAGLLDFKQALQEKYQSLDPVVVKDLTTKLNSFPAQEEAIKIQNEKLNSMSGSERLTETFKLKSMYDGLAKSKEDFVQGLTGKKEEIYLVVRFLAEQHHQVHLRLSALLNSEGLTLEKFENQADALEKSESYAGLLSRVVFREINVNPQIDTQFADIMEMQERVNNDCLSDILEPTQDSLKIAKALKDGRPAEKKESPFQFIIPLNPQQGDEEEEPAPAKRNTNLQRAIDTHGIQYNADNLR